MFGDVPARRRRRRPRLAVGFATALLGTCVGAGAATAQAAGLSSCPPLTTFRASSFPDRPVVDSTLLPLVPGAQRILQGVSNVSGEPLPHQVTFTVTNLTKVIDGVRSVMVHDVDYTNGKLAEEELAFFAQDTAGNVWNLGEYPEQYAGDQLAGAPLTWLAGVDGAEAGIHMPSPQQPIGGPRYLQGWAPGVEFLDCARTIAQNQSTCVPAGCFDGVLVTDETSPLDPTGGSQRKYYAAGIGILQVRAIDDPQNETLVMTSASQLPPDALAAIDARSLVLDRRGYVQNPVYHQVPLADTASPLPSDSTEQPTPTPSHQRPSTDAARLTLSLFAAARRVTRSGKAAVHVVCATPANRIAVVTGGCRGRLELYLRGTRARVGTARFSVAADRGRKVLVPLSRRVLRILHGRGRVSIVVRTRGAIAGVHPVTVSRRLTLVRATPG
ncbi:MAG: hypothetical protein E6G10_21590 [Actinobacteria bacterium]|nr:MAG: hypothetical protein E6G10_21590 [Actinomycetota bacterium]